MIGERENDSMIYPFEAHKIKTKDDEFWVVRSKGLTFCIGDGKTIYEAISNLEENEKVWIETARYFGNKIPPVLVEEI